MKVGVVAAPSFRQYGSELMLIEGFGGGVPCSEIVPMIAPTVAGSTGLVTGPAAGAVSVVVSPPPHAALDRAAQSATLASTRTGIRQTRAYIDDSRILDYCTPPAAVILRSTRSCIHCGLHQSTGVTCWPP